MDMMILGETISGISSADVPYRYGFWMPAGGNDGVGAIEVNYVSVAGWVVHLQTKTSDAVDPSGTSGSIGSVTISATTTTPARYTFPVTDARDLVRYVIVSPSSKSILHFQFAQPLWLPN